MKLAGVIAEYNPFHNGHAHHLAQVRAAGATHIAVVMSGSFVQRGDVACLSKFARARAAVACGADLVVELPTPYAVSSAGIFGRAGVFLLSQLGADLLSFGSEDPEEALRAAAREAALAEESPEMARFLAEGMSFPRARSAAMDALFGGGHGRVVSRPNNLLAVEYLRAAEEYAPGMEALAIPRLHAAHDSDQEREGIASASRLRARMEQGEIECIRPFLPEASFAILREEWDAGRAPVPAGNLERLVLAALRDSTVQKLARLPDVNEGFEHRLFRAAREAGSLQAFCESTKTKRFTMSRIRRIAWNALLGVTREDQAKPPAYLRVLALNTRGTEILARAKQTATIPIGSNFADLYRQSPRGVELDVRATDLHALAMPAVGPCGTDFLEKLTIQS